MAKNRVVYHLVCQSCKERNYTGVAGKKKAAGSLNLQKYCARCRKHNPHKESK